MKELITIKKDIIFKTKINEITSLNLEHDYKIEDDFINGKLILSGTYKMTEASLVEEEFIYNIPFSIALSDEIRKDTIKIEIDDFKYDIHKDVMKITTELELDCEKYESKIGKEFSIDNIDDYLTETILEEEKKEENIVIDEENILEKEIELENALLASADKSIKETLDSKIVTNEDITKLTNIFSTNDQKYHTYKLYIVREGDTVETICNKYNLIIDDIKEYNNLTKLEIGDKIVIPNISND